jgi:geranylgeranyl reductase family protein
VNTLKTVRDAIVIGGGPAGSFSAYELAKRGLDVAVFEEHSTIGLPSHCAGHLSIRSLRGLGLFPLPQGVLENTFSAANFYSPNGTKFSVHLSQPVTCAVNRARFDQLLAEKAQRAGAEFHLDTRVESLALRDGFVEGVSLTKTREQVSARLVVDAEGVSSRLLRQAGLQALNGKELAYAVEAEVEGVCDVEEHAVEVYVGKDFAPNFYGWLIPRPDGTAKVGLATCRGNPKQYFERLQRKHPIASRQLKTAKIKSMAYHAITLGGPLPRAYTNGFLAVGDCASQVKPTTGGGVIFSLTCAKIAAQVAQEALQKGDPSAEALQPYQKRLDAALGFDVSVMKRARKAVYTFSDAKLDRAFGFVQRVGLGKALRDIDEIDFQGRMFFSMLTKPAAYASLAYLLTLSLPL